MYRHESYNKGRSSFTHKGLKPTHIQTSNTPSFGIPLVLPVSHKIELINKKEGMKKIIEYN